MKLAIIACLALLPSSAFAKVPDGKTWYYCASQTSDSKALFYSRAFAYDADKIASVQLGWIDYLKAHLNNVSIEPRGGCLSNNHAKDEAEVANAVNFYISDLKSNPQIKVINTDWQYR